jgi:hypothetical protein
MSESFTGATADALKQKQADDQRRADERAHVKDIARLLGADGLDPSDHTVKQVRKLLADAKRQQDLIANAPPPSQRQRFGSAADHF